MLDTGKARQNADPCQANNPSEPVYIPQMLTRKYGDPQYVYPSMGVYYCVSQAVTNVHVITWRSNRDAKYMFNDRRLARLNIIWWGVGWE
jgi:hypothetical protein